LPSTQLSPDTQPTVVLQASPVVGIWQVPVAPPVPMPVTWQARPTAAQGSVPPVKLSVHMLPIVRAVEVLVAPLLLLLEPLLLLLPLLEDAVLPLLLLELLLVPVPLLEVEDPPSSPVPAA
jgi:hypothetical protein